MFQLFLAWPVESLLAGLCCLWQVPLILWALPITVRCSRLSVCFSCHTLEPVIFTRGPGCFQCLLGFRNQDLCSGCAHCSWGFTDSVPSHRLGQGNKSMCMCVCASMHVYTHICISFCIIHIIGRHIHARVHTYSSIHHRSDKPVSSTW